MTLEKKMAETKAWLEAKKTTDATNEQILSLLDLTCLASEATPDDIRALAKTGEDLQVAALCVLPEHLCMISSANTRLRATVINFPTGDEPVAHGLKILSPLIGHVDEIDYVFPYKTYLAGEKKEALAACSTMSTWAKEHQLTLKVILESGAFPTPTHLYQLSLDVLEVGCDFLKTSTGKIPIGATWPAAFAMLSAIVDSGVTCGIKLSGGLRTLEQTKPYWQLAEHLMKKTPEKTWFRLGSSHLS